MPPPCPLLQRSWMTVLSGAQKHVSCYDQGFRRFCETFSLTLTTVCFHEIWSKIWRLVFYYSSYMYWFCTYLACTPHLHVGGDRGITRKQRNHGAPRSTRKVLVAAQKRRWWNTNIETAHEQPTTAVGHRHTGASNGGKKLGFVKSTRPLKRSDKK